MKPFPLFLFISALSLWVNPISAQTLVGDRWIDNSLTIRVVEESIRKTGQLTICIYSTETEACIENLFTAFETRILDASGKEIWNALWMGQKKTLSFKKPFQTDIKLKLRQLSLS